MKRSLSRSGITWLFISCVAVVAPAAGCTPSNKVPGGAPLMLSFSPVDPTGAPIDLMAEGGAPTVPPLSTFVATFDRLLDPTSLELLDSDGGLTPRAGVGIIQWSGGSVDSSSLYVPNGHYLFTLIHPKGPSITLSPTLGLPSGSTVTVGLDPTKVRSHDQTTPFMAGAGVSMSLTFVTDPLSVTITVPVEEPSDAAVDTDGGSDDAGADAGPPPGVTPPVQPDFVVPISFNNLTADATAAQITAAVSVAGVPILNLGATVARDEMDRAGWTVQPPPGGWPAGATVTVTVGAAAADNFGQTLGAPVTATFTVAP